MSQSKAPSSRRQRGVPVRGEPLQAPSNELAAYFARAEKPIPKGMAVPVAGALTAVQPASRAASTRLVGLATSGVRRGSRRSRGT